jgi:hypothetical protein
VQGIQSNEGGGSGVQRRRRDTGGDTAPPTRSMHAGGARTDARKYNAAATLGDMKAAGMHAVAVGLGVLLTLCRSAICPLRVEIPPDMAATTDETACLRGIALFSRRQHVSPKDRDGALAVCIAGDGGDYGASS